MHRSITYILLIILTFGVPIGVQVGAFHQRSAQQQQTYPQPTAAYFSEKAMRALKQKDSLKFRCYNTQAMHLAILAKDSLAIADVLWNNGAFYLNYKKYDSAYFQYQRSQHLYQKLQHHYYEAKMLYNMAYIKSKIRDYAGSEYLAYQAISKLEPLQKHKTLYHCFNLLGVIYEEMGQYTQALQCLQQAKKHLLASSLSPQYRYLAGLENNLGILYQKSNRLPKAIEYFQRALRHDRLIKKHLILYIKINDNLLYTQWLQNKDSAIQKPLEHMLFLRDSLNHQPGQITSHLHLAQYFLYHADTLQAKCHAKEALHLAQATKLNREVLRAYQLLSAIEPARASAYFKDYAAVQAQLAKQERKVKNNFARIQYETETFIAQNKKLTDQNGYLWSGIAASTVIVGLGYAINRQRQKNKKLYYENETHKAQEKIHRLQLAKMKDWNSAKNQERQRIAADLHDGILSKLFGLRLQWGYLSIPNPKVHNLHQQHLSTLQEIEKEIKAVSYDLQSEILQEHKWSFPQLLQQLITTKEDTYRLSIVLTIHPPIEWTNISSTVKMNLYRILEEALKNAYQHAQCTGIRIQLSQQHEQLSLNFQDNGIGLQSNEQQGLGLQNIKSRVQQLQGEVAIHSSEAGLHLHLQIPINS